MKFKSGKIDKKTISQLREMALRAATRAYAPYSHIHVGAALLASDGNIYLGCNVENASYGLTICAERAAISAAIQMVEHNRKSLIRAIYVVNDKQGVMPPCGACRQVIFEFGHGGTIFFQGNKGVKELPVAKILPEAFQL